MTVVIPPLGEQRAIAEVLGGLDDKIESNRRANRLCTEIAESAFQAALWDGGVPWETAWPEQALGEVLDVIETGGRPRGGVAGITSGFPSIGAESIVEVGHFDFGKTKFVPVAYFDTMTRGHVEDETSCCTRTVVDRARSSRTFRWLGRVSRSQDALSTSTVYRLRVAPPFSQDFLYFWLRSSRLTEEMRRRGTGVAIPGLNSTNVKALPVIIPDRTRLSTFKPSPSRL